MKRLLKPISASTNYNEVKETLTLDEVLLFLQQIKELQGKDINYKIREDETVEFTIDDFEYELILD